MSTLSHTFFVIHVIVRHTSINAQPEELFYSFNFEQPSDWTEHTGSWNSTADALWDPIAWHTAKVDCPRGSTVDQTCVHFRKDASLSRTIPTIGFHSIRLRIDAHAVDVETTDDEYCFVQYRTDELNWNNVNVVTGQGHWALDFNINIPDTSSYNNQQSFQVKVGINAKQSDDNCYFDNLRMSGIPYTPSPTIPSANPSVNPSVTLSNEPSFNPSMNPSQRSFNPSQFPSKYPTVQRVPTIGEPTMTTTIGERIMFIPLEK
eukprot:231303_1